MFSLHIILASSLLGSYPIALVKDTVIPQGLEESGEMKFVLQNESVQVPALKTYRWEER